MFFLGAFLPPPQNPMHWVAKCRGSIFSITFLFRCCESASHIWTTSAMAENGTESSSRPAKVPKLNQPGTYSTKTISVYLAWFLTHLILLQKQQRNRKFNAVLFCPTIALERFFLTQKHIKEQFC
jgi:hypothetical protein